jgi:hypothetical protein
MRQLLLCTSIVGSYFFVAGCATSSGLTRGIKEPSDMQRIVRTAVPPGSDLQDAQRFMEKEGFHCSRQTNTSFGGRIGIDYLWCDRSDGGVVKRRWQVAIVHQNGKVSEILATTGLVGP